MSVVAGARADTGPDAVQGFAGRFPKMTCAFRFYIAPTFGAINGAAHYAKGTTRLVLTPDTIAKDGPLSLESPCVLSGAALQPGMAGPPIVAVCEDDADIRELLAAYLVAQGFVVETAGDAAAPQRVLSRDQLLDATRGWSADLFDRTIDMQVSRLRRRLEEAGIEVAALIRTVRNAGYILAASVRRR